MANEITKDHTKVFIRRCGLSFSLRLGVTMIFGGLLFADLTAFRIWVRIVV